MKDLEADSTMSTFLAPLTLLKISFWLTESSFIANFNACYWYFVSVSVWNFVSLLLTVLARPSLEKRYLISVGLTW